MGRIGVEQVLVAPVYPDAALTLVVGNTVSGDGPECGFTILPRHPLFLKVQHSDALAHVSHRRVDVAQQGLLEFDVGRDRTGL